MLGAGTKLGPYEIVAPLGAVGMGEVHKERADRGSRSRSSITTRWQRTQTRGRPSRGHANHVASTAPRVGAAAGPAPVSANSRGAGQCAARLHTTNAGRQLGTGEASVQFSLTLCNLIGARIAWSG
jgi:hypothetical protein